MTVFELQRAELVEQLRKRGIVNEAVLAAVGAVAREEFVPDAFRSRAYEDSALPIDCQQTISQPYTVAYMTSLLDLKPDDRVLEVGTGSGYQAAVLAQTGARVFSIERIPELHYETRERLDRLGLPIATHLGDGSIGWREFAPYDAIIVTAGSPDVPQALIDQLGRGGRLVIPIGDRSGQVLYRIRRDDNGNLLGEEFHEFRFVPLIGKQAWDK